jgi:hypothetical protein
MAVDGWATVFEIDRTDMNALFSRTAQLFELATETRRLIEELTDEEPEIVLEHFQQIDNTLANFPRLGQLQMGQFLEPLDPRSGQYCLKLCSSLLHRYFPELRLESDQIDRLLKHLDDLLIEVRSTEDLESSAQQWLLSRLLEVREKLARLSYLGVPDLEQSAEKLVGGIISKRERIAAISRSKIAKTLAGFILALDTALNIAANLSQITNGGAPPPAPSIEIIQQQLNVVDIYVPSSDLAIEQSSH